MKKVAVKDFVFVSLQVLLFIAFVFPIVEYSFEPNYILKYAALAIAIIGLLVIAVAILQLNKNLTPFPTPKENGTLIQTGLYKFVRHPIYSGIILTTLGFGFYDGSWWKIVIGFALWFLFFFKSKYEETLLTNQFDDYKNYKKITGRFFPFL
jgi:protein-S-isoprenylcysteine O-methyltransferase Ste14